MSTSLSASRVATLVGDFDRDPAYAGLAGALRLLVGDGRLPLGARLPSERDLTTALGVSRTTTARAYALLREQGYAETRRGAGTYTRLPNGYADLHDRALRPRPDETLIDLTCAATSPPPGLAEAYAWAAEELPAYLGGHGYYPVGMPVLQAAIAATYDARGLPTAPGQVLVTAGALAATAVVARALTGAGDRVLVESPTYPNATLAYAGSGARLVGAPVDPGGWDLDASEAVLRQASPRAAYLIPDFQNPTGHLMSDEQRERCAHALRRSRTTVVVDEANQALALDGQAVPRPFAAHLRGTVTLGSASKSYWGGLRLGWVRVPDGQPGLLERLTSARLAFDLGAPVMEQLALVRLLEQGEELLEHRRTTLRAQRDALVAAVRELLPDWTFHVPGGGLALWCALPRDRGATSQVSAMSLCARAERLGVALAPGPLFAVEGGLDGFVRIPWTQSPDRLRAAVERLALAWAAETSGSPASTATGVETGVGAAGAPGTSPAAGGAGAGGRVLVA